MQLLKIQLRGYLPDFSKLCWLSLIWCRLGISELLQKTVKDLHLCNNLKDSVLLLSDIQSDKLANMQFR